MNLANSVVGPRPTDNEQNAEKKPDIKTAPCINITMSSHATAI